MSSVGLGNRSLDVSLAERILAAIEDLFPVSTGDIAARLLIRAESPERRVLNDELTAMRKRRVIRYEHRPDGVIVWRPYAASEFDKGPLSR